MNTSAITAVTKSSIKPATENVHLCGSGERNGEKRTTKVSFGRTVM